MGEGPTNPHDELAARATLAEKLGAAGEAQALWRELAARAPAHPRVLLRQARAQIQARNPRAAIEMLKIAMAASPRDPELPLELALALRVMGDLNGALAAIDAALAIDPYDFLALLSKASLLEQTGQKKAAARAYRSVLKVAPQPERVPPGLKAPLAHAKEAVARDAEAVADFLRRETAAVRAGFEGADLSRFDESLEIFAGTKRAYVHEPLLFNLPKLPALTFYDRAYFPWLSTLEAATSVFQRELDAVLKADWSRFRPYIQVPAGAPVNQWAELNNSRDWSTFFFWEDGRRNDENCSRCPESAAVLRSLPLADQPGFSPTAMFSVLQPRTAIPPHTGSTNVRLICHLPLILPGNCRFRVGNDLREWRMGEAFVFDDSIEHEAWNDSDEVRVVLIFDVWNPLLTEAERVLVGALLSARNAYYANEA